MGRTLRIIVKLLGAVIALPLAYALVALAGAIPTGGDDRGTPADGVQIFVISNGFHTDIVVPMQAQGVDWALELRAGHFTGANPISASHAAFGWGDRGFYLNTPSLMDITPAAAFEALFASTGSLVHVTLWGEAPVPGPDVRPLRLSVAQYLALTENLRAAFVRDDTGAVRPLPGTGYRWYDTFYEGVGTYSLVDTCNEWTAWQLRRIGVAVGWWAPFPFGVMWHL